MKKNILAAVFAVIVAVVSLAKAEYLPAVFHGEAVSVSDTGLAPDCSEGPQP